jgi:hypothetical protein
MKPIRHEYGTPRYEIAPGVETPNADLARELLDIPVTPGFYVRVDGAWLPTDGLTYRERFQTIRVY